MDNKLLRLPPGFRFHPTDEELVVQYLRRKVFSCPLPASFIPEIRPGEHNPWDLLVGSDQDQERYFFNLRDRGLGRRATGSGYWKAAGKDKAVVSPKCGRVVGTKKAFVFHRGRAPRGERTDWVMHEYRLASSSTDHHRRGVAAAREWALCRVFRKKRATTTDVDTNRPSSPSGSESSCVTEAGGGDDMHSENDL